MLAQLLQLVGAILVLAGFTLAQLRILDPQSIPYLIVNAVGAGILAVLAFEERQWGFLLLEGVWTLVSLAGLVNRLRRPSAVPAGAAGSADARRSPARPRR
jgi:hypothetical protein